ncbi:MAG TPA: hypothetical protein VGG12_02735, partial [Methylovirgula sp.]
MPELALTAVGYDEGRNGAYRCRAATAKKVARIGRCGDLLRCAQEPNVEVADFFAQRVAIEAE